MTPDIPHRHMLSTIADKAMKNAGFLLEYSESLKNELEKIQSPSPTQNVLRDLRDYLWISIDHKETQDIDQLTFAERLTNGKERIYIAIADVDIFVQADSELDKFAAHNIVTVYTPTKNFPMIPEKLSNNLSSLKENADRCAMVIEIEIESDGKFGASQIYSAWVHNHAKLSYDEVANWLKFSTPLPNPFTNRIEILNQLKLQDSIASLIKKYRYHHISLTFVMTEIEPIIVDGIAVGIEESKHNRAHGIIENYMIAANVIISRYLFTKKIPALRRVVIKPKRWDRILTLAKERNEILPLEPDAKALGEFLIKQQKANPSDYPALSLAIIKLVGRGEYIAAIPGDESFGHFKLSLPNFSRATAPNRRYTDLVLQRQLKTHLNGSNPQYSKEELDKLAPSCTQKEDDAYKIDRLVRKCAVAMVLSTHIGEDYQAIVTGVTHGATFVRVINPNPPIEGRLIDGYEGLDVGDRVSVKLIQTNIENGYIDFSRINKDA